MKGLKALVPLLLALASLVVAWTDQDHEIFRLRDEVISSEGPNATFYSFLGVRTSASIDDINRAYRKLSRTLHPDKARSVWLSTYDQYDPKKAKAGDTPGVKVQVHKKPSKREMKAFDKESSARFARLGVVANILRAEERARYDHFLNNGFPIWRGTDYYYRRFRPGLGSVLTGLFVFIGGGMHYLTLYLNWKNHREFVGRYIKHARRMAWGDDTALGNIPGLAMNGTSTPPTAEGSEEEQATTWNRRERRLREKERAKDKKLPKIKAHKAKEQEIISGPEDARLTSGPVGAKKRTVAENGKVLIVDSVGNVFLEQETDEGQVHEFLLDVDEIPKPTIYDTVLFRLPLWAWNKSVGKWTGKQTLEAEIADLVGEKDVDEDEKALRSALPLNAATEARRRRMKNKPRT